MGLWWTALALATPTVDAVKAAIEAHNGKAVHALPALGEGQIRELLGGGCVRVLSPSEAPDGPSTAVGMVLSSIDRRALWLAAQDPHAVVDPDLTEFVVEQEGRDAALWYGYWDLPKPVQDRQWVVRSWNNHALASATGDVAWEHVWKLVDDGLERVRPMAGQGRAAKVDAAMLDQAIFTPVNEGSWSMVQVGERTLLAYQASSVVGGSVPDWLVARLVMARLESVLRGVEERATAWAPHHYGTSHAPVYGGDGEALGALGARP